MRVLLALLLSLPASAATCSGFWPSLAFGIGAQGADIASSWGRYELNPVLGRGTFGRRQTVRKLTLFAGTGVSSYMISRTERGCRVATVLNLSAGGLTFGVAVRNWRVR